MIHETNVLTQFVHSKLIGIFGFVDSIKASQARRFKY